MELKDKLVKNHHKGIYYKTRQFMLCSVIAIASISVVAIPTYIALNNDKQNRLIAQEEEEEKRQAEEAKTKEVEYLSYNDII